MGILNQSKSFYSALPFPEYGMNLFVFLEISFHNNSIQKSLNKYTKCQQKRLITNFDATIYYYLIKNINLEFYYSYFMLKYIFTSCLIFNFFNIFFVYFY